MFFCSSTWLGTCCNTPKKGTVAARRFAPLDMERFGPKENPNGALWAQAKSKDIDIGALLGSFLFIDVSVLVWARRQGRR